MKSSTKRWIIIAAIVVAIIVIIVLMTQLNKATEIPFSGTENSLLSKVEAGEISDLYVSGGYEVTIKYKGNEKSTAFAYIPSREAFLAAIEQITAAEGYAHTAPVVHFDNPSSRSNWVSIAMPLVSIAVIIIFFIILMRSAGGGNNKALNFGKTKANVISNSKVRFADVAGAEEEKEELREIVDFLKDPKKFRDIGARVPKGVLLVGPPGTGKTLFAKAVAGEANVPFFSISGSDFVEMFVGVGASRVRDLFDQAKRSMPCIIFIDEIDAVGRQRGAGLGGGNDEREQTLNQLLVQMDGFQSNEGIIIIAATNRADILDPALMRPGRFDRQVYVNIPDVRGREAIFKVHTRNKSLEPSINFKTLSRMTSGFTGADIENLLNEAAILAARDNRKVISMKDIYEAINKVIAGPQKKSRLVTESDKRITAYHESGHAIVTKLLEYCDDVHEVSIIPRGMAAGYTITLPDTDDSHVTLNKLNDTIAMLLAGRAAEEVVIQDISTGASSDIQRASSVARKMVTEWGMSAKLGNMYLGASQEVFLGRDFQTQLTYSDQVAATIDNEVKVILDRAYKRALDIIRANRDVMERMVKLLYEKETIYHEEVEMLFEGKSVEEIIAADVDPLADMDNFDKAVKTAPAAEAKPAKDKPAAPAAPKASGADAPKNFDDLKPKKDEDGDNN